MGKLSKEEMSRNQGIVFAYEQAKKAQENGLDPVEALKNEIEYRGINNVAVLMSATERARYRQLVTERIINMVSLLSAVTLREKFGFGAKRLKDFFTLFETKTLNLVNDDEASIDNYIQKIQEETGIYLTVSDGLGKGTKAWKDK